MDIPIYLNVISGNEWLKIFCNIATIEEDFWNKINKEYHAEKAELIEQLNRIMDKLACINKADDEFYKQSDLILKFCKNASKIFLKATPSEKRTICEIIGSNFTANAKKIDITLYPVFYDIWVYLGHLNCN